MASNLDAEPTEFRGVPRKDRWFELALRGGAAGIGILLVLFGTLWTQAIFGCLLFIVAVGQSGRTKLPFGPPPRERDDPWWYTRPNRGYLNPPGPSATATFWGALLSLPLMEAYATFGGLETPDDAKALWVLFFVIVSQLYMVACVTGRAWMDEAWIERLHRNWDHGVGAGAAEMTYFKSKHHPSERHLVYRSFTPGDDIILAYNLISLMTIVPIAGWFIFEEDITDLGSFFDVVPSVAFLLIPLSLVWPIFIARGPLREKPRETALHWSVIKTTCWLALCALPMLAFALGLMVPSSDPIDRAQLALMSVGAPVSAVGVLGLICAFRGIGIRPPDPSARPVSADLGGRPRRVRGGLRVAYHGLLTPLYLGSVLLFIGALAGEPHEVAAALVVGSLFSILACSAILLVVGYAARPAADEAARSHWLHIIRTSWHAILCLSVFLPLSALLAAAVLSLVNPDFSEVASDDETLILLLFAGVVVSITMLMMARAARNGLKSEGAMKA